MSSNGNASGHSSHAATEADSPNHKRPQRPLLLHPIVCWSLVASFVVLGCAISVLASYSQKHNGLFTIPPHQGLRDDALRSIWSSGPTFLMTVIAGGILLPMALAIFLVAPYAELENGQRAKAEESIGANYAFLDTKGRMTLAMRNKKWGLVSLTAVTVLAFGLDVTASGLIDSRNVVMTSNVPVQFTAHLGLEPSTDRTNSTTDADGNHLFLNSDQYLAAALYAGGGQLYKPSATRFSYENWFVTPFNISSQDLQSLGYRYGVSGTTNVTIRTYGVNTNANCRMADSITFSDNNSSTVTLDTCSFTFPIEGWPVPGSNTPPGYSRTHFTNSTQCQNSSDDFAFKTLIYAIYRPSGYTARDPKQFLIMLCQPTISVAKVNATLAISPTGDVGALIKSPDVIERFPKGSNLDNPEVASLLGPPLNGMAVNGYDIAEPAELDNSTARKTRVYLTQAILKEGIYGAILEHIGTGDSSNPSTDWFGNDTNRVHFSKIVSEFYQAYLNAFTPNIYFNTNTSTTAGAALVYVSVDRAWVSILHAVGLGVLLFVLAFLMVITLIHQHIPNPDGHAWRMYPGTILSHLSISAPQLSQLVGPYSDWKVKHIARKLKDQRFSINETGMLEVHQMEDPEVDVEAGHPVGLDRLEENLHLAQGEVASPEDVVESGEGELVLQVGRNVERPVE